MEVVLKTSCCTCHSPKVILWSVRCWTPSVSIVAVRIPPFLQAPYQHPNSPLKTTHQQALIPKRLSD